jgi:transcriptional regulator with XRE-family HTH domain
VSERSGLTCQAVSKLENGHNVNPTLEIHYRYAMALDAGVTLGFEPIEVEDD